MRAPGGYPLVTAIVPTYNGAELVRRTLDSLAAQTWPALEILIGDDASTDLTGEIVDAFATNHENVSVIHREANLGWLRNSNDLLSRAEGEFCFFAFHDDVVDRDYVERLARALIADPHAVLSFADMTVTELDGGERVHRFTGLSGLAGARQRGLVMARRPDDWWVPNRGLFRTSAYRQVGGIRANRSGEFSADWTWLLHLCLIGGFVRVPEVLCHKYYTKQSLSRSWEKVSRQFADLTWAAMGEVVRSPAGGLTKLVVVGRLLVTFLRFGGRALAKRVLRGRD